MPAPSVAKPQMKADGIPTGRPAHRRSAVVGYDLDHNPVEQSPFPQRSTGNQARLRVLRQRASGAAQAPAAPSLIVGPIDDPLEREADRVAEQVAGTPGTALSAAPAPPRVSRKCAACDADAQTLQTKPVPSSQPPVRTAPGIVHDVLRTPGQPLDPASRAFFEPRFGNDLGEVRIHADTRAADSARAVDARAYTVGQHVVFGHDRYAPGTADGRRLLAHELVHTVQQRSGAAGLQRDPNDPAAPSPARPGLEARLKVIEETGPAVQARLTDIIENGGPIPTSTKVIGAAIIDVEGYDGPREMRAINGADTDALGRDGPVFHATTPTNRTLTATQGRPTERGGRTPAISGPRGESINAHLNDAEIKLFEAIIARLPKDAKGTIYFATMRVRVQNGRTVLEPYPACSGCVRASFETAGQLAEIDLVSHAPVHPTGTADLGGPPAEGGGGGGKPAQGGPTAAKPAATSPESAEPPAPGGGAPAKAPAPSPVTAEPSAQGGGTPAKPATPSTGTEPETGTAPAPRVTGTASQPTRFTGAAIEFGSGLATLGLGWLSAYLKAKIDQKIAAKQIDALLAEAKARINLNPDEALKKMMFAPEVTVYAWVSLDSAVISTLEAGGLSGEPTMSDSSPMMDILRIDYAYQEVPQELVNSFPSISGGGRHITMVRTIVIDIPLHTPSIENMIAYAKARSLPLDDLLAYASYRYQRALAEYQLAILDKGDVQKRTSEENYWKGIVDQITPAVRRP